MMHTRSFIFDAAALLATLQITLAAAIVPARACLQYDKPVVLTGRLSTQKTDYRGERPDFSFLLLTLDTSICVKGAGGLSADDTEYRVREMHVEDRTCIDQKAWGRGARVKISGELFHRHVLRHRTRALSSGHDYLHPLLNL
jgi:hypothetical protein